MNVHRSSFFFCTLSVGLSMSRHRRRPPKPWGIVVIAIIVGFLPLVPLPFELLDNSRRAVFRMVLIGPVWLSLGVGLLLRFNVARIAVQLLLSLQLVAQSLFLVCYIERETLWTLLWFMAQAVASLGVLEFLRRPDVRAVFTGEEQEPMVIELEPLVSTPEPEAESTAFFRDPSHSDRYNDH
jgi:hypothetical protein